MDKEEGIAGRIFLKARRNEFDFFNLLCIRK